MFVFFLFEAIIAVGTLWLGANIVRYLAISCGLAKNVRTSSQVFTLSEKWIREERKK